MKKIPSVFALCLSLQSVPAAADSLYLAGASRGASSNYAFLGAILPLPGSDLGSGPALRVWADHLEYSYTAGATDITASGWGGALAAVYQFSGDWGWANLSAGMALRDLRLSAPDPGNRDRGAHGDFNVQADGGYNLDSDWRVRGFASYTPRTEGYMTQAGLDRNVWEDVRLGVSATLQGDRNYSQMSGGAVAYIGITQGLELAPSVGVSHSSDKTGAYGGVTLVLVD